MQSIAKAYFYRKVKFLLLITIMVIFTGTYSLSSERLSVSGQTAKVRSGPGAKHPVIWQVEKYYPVLVIEKSGEWIHFRDFQGDEGWLHTSLMDKTASVITKQISKIRSGPGSKYEVIVTIEPGIPFKIIENKGEWLKIEHKDGEKGWINKSLVW